MVWPLPAAAVVGGATPPSPPPAVRLPATARAVGVSDPHSRSRVPRTFPPTRALTATARRPTSVRARWEPDAAGGGRTVWVMGAESSYDRYPWDRTRYAPP